MIASAPESLNTLYELAQALANDPNHATTVFAQLATKGSTADVDGQLVLKANQPTTYTKTEVDNALAPKATTAYVDVELVLKANKSDSGVGPQSRSVHHIHEDRGQYTPQRKTEHAYLQGSYAI